MFKEITPISGRKTAQIYEIKTHVVPVIRLISLKIFTLPRRVRIFYFSLRFLLFPFKSLIFALCTAASLPHIALTHPSPWQTNDP